MSSRRLVPGDVIVVLPGKATCDLVLLQGTCLVEESNLTGEVTIHIPPVVAAYCADMMQASCNNVLRSSRLCKHSVVRQATSQGAQLHALLRGHQT